MQDLDFDELDKAVNSLVQNTIPTLTPDSEPQDTILDLGSGKISMPDMTTQSVITPISNATPVQSPLAGRRSNGRFMDVVPPSSNTRVNPTMPERVSRQGVTLDPIDNNLPMIPADESLPAVADDVKNTQWPDPINFQSNNQDQSSEPVKEDNEDADIDRISNDIDNTINQSLNEPQDSPFLSGAKVDKRPLGAFSSDQPAQIVSESVDKPLEHTDLAQDTQPQTEIASVIPAELHPDLLSIESDSTTVPDVPGMHDVNQFKPEPSVVAVSTSSVVNTTVVAAAPVVEASVSTNQPEGPVSITQQYSEQPSTGDQTTGAIYDTDSYHKAILAPTKKKSGWMIVLWITVLVVVGAGAGAAVYFFVLPR